MPKEKKRPNSVFLLNGASCHTEGERAENDYYATEPKATELLLKIEAFNKQIWECACGAGHISKVLLRNNFNVRSTDIILRENYAQELLDFLSIDNIEIWQGDIITNPPYSHSEEFAEKALSLLPNGNKLAMFLPIQFLEGKKRRYFFDRLPPKTVYVSSSRLCCAKDGDFVRYKASARCYCWFIWEKGFTGTTELKFFN